MPNLRQITCTFISDTKEEIIINSDYIDKDKWYNLCVEFHDLIKLNCVIQYSVYSSMCSEIDFVRAITNTSRTYDRLIDIHFHYNNENMTSITKDVSMLQLRQNSIRLSELISLQQGKCNHQLRKFENSSFFW